MGGAMPSSDEVPPSSVAKAATRELPNKGANSIMSQGTSALPKDKGPAPTTDPGKAVVTKRQHSDTPSSPGYHNVYVRRKVESEHNKVNSSQEQKGNGRDKTKEQEAPLQDVQHDEVKKPQVASPVDKPVEVGLVSSISSEKLNVEAVPQKTEPPAASAAGIQDDAQKLSVQDDAQQLSFQDDARQLSVQDDAQQLSVQDDAQQLSVQDCAQQLSVQDGAQQLSVQDGAQQLSVQDDAQQLSVQDDAQQLIVQDDAQQLSVQDDAQQLSVQYWSERFNRLQTYLENCDRSSQEGYLRKLRSLSAAGRSTHAIDLEKRAIHLLVEEGKELQRMKALNVLGKVSPNASSKQNPLQRRVQK